MHNSVKQLRSKRFQARLSNRVNKQRLRQVPTLNEATARSQDSAFVPRLLALLEQGLLEMEGITAVANRQKSRRRFASWSSLIITIIESYLVLAISKL